MVIEGPHLPARGSRVPAIEGRGHLNIIFVSGATARARTLTLDWRHWTGGAISLLVLFLSFTLLFNYVTLRYAASINHPLLQAIVLADQRQEAQKTQEVVESHLNLMAVKLGELQAQMLRLDGLGERLAKLAGLEAAGTAADAATRRGPGTRWPGADASPGPVARGIQRDAGGPVAPGRAALGPAGRAGGVARHRLGEPEIPAFASRRSKTAGFLPTSDGESTPSVARKASMKASTFRRTSAPGSSRPPAARSSSRTSIRPMVK